jgi:DNA-binding MarR family transcriptional regulator
MTTSPSFLTIIRQWAEVFVRRSMRDFKRFMDESGLSPSQINTLMRLKFNGACGVSDIGEHIGITSAAASQMIDRLVNLGYIQRIEDPQDRRAKHISLSLAGQALVDQGIEARRAWMEQLTSQLTTEQQDTIAAALTMLTEAAYQLEKEERV